MYLSRAQAQERIGVSRDTLRKLVKSGALKAHKLGDARNSPLRFSPEDIDAYMERCAVKADSAAAS